MWILAGTTVFQVGYPIVVSAAYGTENWVTATALVFLVMCFLMHLGSALARILTLLLSALVSGWLLFVMFRDLDLMMRHLDEHWLQFLLVPVIPMIGYGVAAVLLCSPSVASRQLVVWRALVPRMQTLTNEQQPAEPLDESLLEVCPWCEERGISEGKDFCLACKRPVG